MDDNDPARSTSINVTILAQSGSRTTLVKLRNATIRHVKEDLLTTWPSDFGDSPSKVAQLRLIHAGKILQDDQDLETLTPNDNTVIMHVSVIPASLANSTGKSRETTKAGCCIVS